MPQDKKRYPQHDIGNLFNEPNNPNVQSIRNDIISKSYGHGLPPFRSVPQYPQLTNQLLPNQSVPFSYEDALQYSNQNSSSPFQQWLSGDSSNGTINPGDVMRAVHGYQRPKDVNLPYEGAGPSSQTRRRIVGGSR